MSREEVIRQIVARESNERGLLEATVCKEDAELHAEACEQFGTWETALEYAGVDVQRLVRNRKASPHTIRSGIRRLAGGPYRLNAVVVSRRHWRLYHAAVRYFGSWRLALEAAGVNPENIHAYSKQERPSREQIIDILVKRSEQGESLRWIDVCCENRALAVAVKSTFATWSKALHAAGLISEPRERNAQSKWTQEKVIASLKSQHALGLPWRGLSVRDPALYSAARRCFVGLPEALVAAGLKNSDSETDTN